MEAKESSARTLSHKFKVTTAAFLVAAGTFTTSVPAAHAVGNVDWTSISCNYGYYIALHSNGTHFVQHTMRNVGSNPATNKIKTWDNPFWGAPRVWGAGYQSSSFSQVYTSH